MLVTKVRHSAAGNGKIYLLVFTGCMTAVSGVRSQKSRKQKAVAQKAGWLKSVKKERGGKKKHTHTPHKKADKVTWLRHVGAREDETVINQS